ncbi:uncharacterized protein [Neodiprion pinetum]|uniref:Uncharacterized protein LOC107225853 isoform X2 n=1 Tax=Neodiprion lecontei TaxID=441921 RepID=A0A6J0C5T0_NEOLC|nr:uncharacterized protein LOC107225853 isoform X2 [Neodiprion lecontei]XP_046471532.1 uncharacterized protein LOC124213873 isoform X2 [Neodiprion pinetum]XP_046609529.1 uncharacterized protein LOC124299994 isoform X2 [Neodiprion virginianus]
MKSLAALRRFQLFYAPLFLLSAATGVRGLRDVSIKIPLAVAPGSTVTMTCQYDLEADLLYTVKWYKGRKEFFRYVLKELPHTKVFPLPGVNVDTALSDSHHVVLHDVQSDLTGKYRCEVSADAPSFHTEMVSSYMHVVNLPEGDPEIRVEKMKYAVGDVVRGNCTSPPGNPPANVTWSVNGLPVNSSYSRSSPSKAENPLVSVVAGLDLEIAPDSFNHGRLHITCRVNVFDLYTAQSEIFVEEERPRLASVLGTRESSYTGKAGRRVEQWIFMVAVTNLLLYSLR